MLTCKQASQLISRSLDHPLSWSERLQLKLHLVICDACRQFRQHINLLHVAVQRIRSATENDSSIQLAPEVKDRIMHKVTSGD